MGVSLQKKPVRLRSFLRGLFTRHGAPSVCHLYYQYFGTLIHREAKALREHGYRVDVVCLRNSKNEDRIQDVDGINVLQIQTRETAEKSTFVYFLRLGLFFVKSFFLLTFLQISRRYRVVHVTSPPDIMVFAALVPKLFRSKIILDIHDIGPELYMRKLGVPPEAGVIKTIKFMEKISTRFANHVITVTHLWRDRLIERSLPPEKCSVLLNVPDEDVFAPAPTTANERAKDTFDMYYPGSLEEHFGVDLLIDAMPLIQREVPGIKLHVYCGKKGRLYDSLIERIADLEMQDHIEFNDYVPFYRLPEILRDADVGVAPTKGDVFSDEAVSMKSIEFIFLGIPVVISKTRAHSYYYDDSMVKFFEPGSKDGLAEAVVSLYRSPADRAQMIANSQRFIDRYSWNKRSKREYTAIVDGLSANHG